MFVEGGWQRPEEPPPKPRLSRREEQWLLWMIGLGAVLMLVAPLGGSTLVQAAMAFINRS